MNGDFDSQASDIFEQQALAGEVARQSQLSAATQYILEEQQKSLAETQLEVDSIISKCYHLLKQDVLRPDDNGKLDWYPISDSSKLVLTKDGVEKIMQLINFYINKNNLLTNFDEDEINMLMRTFMVELNSLLFLKYEILFRQPTFEEVRQIILDKQEEKVKLRAFASELLGIKADKDEIREQLLQEMEARIEDQFKKIKTEQRKEKLKEYWIIIAQLEAIVYSALNRAYMGEERGSIRRHQQVSQILSDRPSQIPKAQGGIAKWLS